jgi:hypothetical protein
MALHHDFFCQDKRKYLPYIQSYVKPEEWAIDTLAAPFC